MSPEAMAAVVDRVEANGWTICPCGEDHGQADVDAGCLPVASLCRAGPRSPPGVAVARAKWDADAVRDGLCGFVVEHLHDGDAVQVVDETGDLKKGTHTVGSSASTPAQPDAGAPCREVCRQRGGRPLFSDIEVFTCPGEHGSGRQQCAQRRSRQGQTKPLRAPVWI
ncbi:hypothetical protein GCM10017688_15290 [Streptomyces ramulosus]